MRPRASGSYIREHGDGQAVVCIHGPLRSSIARCWLSSPLEACAGSHSTFPGSGWRIGPRKFDYTWIGLGRFCVAAVDSLKAHQRPEGRSGQIAWGAEDPALKLAVHGGQARGAARLDQIHTVPAKHLLEEDRASGVAEYVAGLAGG